jgi:flagellar L-ring protein precursor FlgH
MRGALWLLGVAALALGGCNTAPSRDPAFAAVRPQMVAPPPPTAGSLYRPGYDLVLFEDLRARRVGDILSIRLNENTDATKSAGTTIDKTNDTVIANPTIFGASPSIDLPGIVPLTPRKRLGLDSTLNSETAFEGDAESTQSNSLTGDIAVTVAEVLPNGNLVVQGEKILTLNQGHEHIRISGIVRPEDINPDNSVDSTRVAAARIIYAGEGPTADASKLGWLARFFISAIFPF